MVNNIESKIQMLINLLNLNIKKNRKSANHGVFYNYAITPKKNSSFIPKKGWSRKHIWTNKGPPYDA